MLSVSSRTTRFILMCMAPHCIHQYFAHTKIVAKKYAASYFFFASLWSLAFLIVILVSYNFSVFPSSLFSTLLFSIHHYTTNSIGWYVNTLKMLLYASISSSTYFFRVAMLWYHLLKNDMLLVRYSFVLGDPIESSLGLHQTNWQQPIVSNPANAGTYTLIDSMPSSERISYEIARLIYCINWWLLSSIGFSVNIVLVTQNEYFLLLSVVRNREFVKLNNCMNCEWFRSNYMHNA